MVVLSATVLATMNVLGVTLIAAALVVPAVVARMLTDSFGKMLGLACLIGAISGFVGMNASYHLDVASGPTIVLTSASFFIVAFVAGGQLRRRAPSATPTDPVPPMSETSPAPSPTPTEASGAQAARRAAITAAHRSGSLAYGA
jgi:hypothetical protein